MVQFRIREEIIIDHNEILKYIKSCSFVTEVFIDENKCIRPEIKYNTSDVDLRKLEFHSNFLGASEKYRLCRYFRGL